MGAGVLNVIHCERTRHVMREALNAGWEWIGYTKGGHVEIRWPENGALIHCATTPSDPNSWKAFAKEIERVSGVEVWRKGNRRRSRRRTNGADVQVQAARRKHREEYEQRLAQQEAARQAARTAELRRRADAERAAAADEHRHEIEALMRPGWGH